MIQPLRVCFFGHRSCLPTSLRPMLKDAVERLILNGCYFFTMGTHGDFDSLALSVCMELRKKYPQIEIEIAFSNLPCITQNAEFYKFHNLKTCLYETEEVHFKNRISFCNKQMINSCNFIVCYVDDYTFPSGARNALKYAIKRNLHVINLYNKTPT